MKNNSFIEKLNNSENSNTDEYGYINSNNYNCKDSSIKSETMLNDFLNKDITIESIIYKELFKNDLS